MGGEAAVGDEAAGAAAALGARGLRGFFRAGFGGVTGCSSPTTGFGSTVVAAGDVNISGLMGHLHRHC